MLPVETITYQSGTESILDCMERRKIDMKKHLERVRKMRKTAANQFVIYVKMSLKIYERRVS